MSLARRPRRRRVTARPPDPGEPQPGPADPPVPAPPARRRFRRLLLAWYRANGRQLPWRETSDPYHILVSEVMLQQTQVDRVLPKYHEWLARYPSLAALAAAADDEVAAAWRPLGYNVRPRRLQWIARESVQRFGGSLPSDEATLLSFKGLGRYTVGAIRSFAFGQRAAIVDTNVARLLFRVFVRQGDARAHATRKHLWALSETLVPRKEVFDFNQALMDLGATVCTARAPLCGRCPLRRMCVTYPFAAHTKPGVAGNGATRAAQPPAARGVKGRARRKPAARRAPG